MTDLVQVLRAVMMSSSPPTSRSIMRSPSTNSITKQRLLLTSGYGRGAVQVEVRPSVFKKSLKAESLDASSVKSSSSRVAVRMSSTMATTPDRRTSGSSSSTTLLEINKKFKSVLKIISERGKGSINSASEEAGLVETASEASEVLRFQVVVVGGG